VVGFNAPSLPLKAEAHIPLTIDDIENQQAVRLAKEADPEGERTIGAITDKLLFWSMLNPLFYFQVF
jgi:hypothetical protein